MQKFLHVLALAFSLLSIGCEPMRGILEVSETFNLISRDPNCIPGRGGSCQPEKVIDISPGRNEMTVNFLSEREFHVKVGTHQVVFNIPKGKQLPTDNGEFFLTAKESKQPVDLAGHLQTQRARSETIQAVEPCQVRQSHLVCDGTGKNRRCWREDHYYDGWQRVEYYLLHTDRNIVLNILKASDSEAQPVGNFQGSSQSTEKVYTFVGMCR